MIYEEILQEKLALLDNYNSLCTHCGLCSEACATFTSSGYEHESPRGRLLLAAQFLNGKINPQSFSLSTFDRCLGCHACETLCPHQVPYVQVRDIVQELRRELFPLSSSVFKSHHKHWITFARRVSNRLWRRFGSRWLTIPELSLKRTRSFISKKVDKTTTRFLAVCCVQDLFQHEVIDQTLDFMQRIGCPLKIDRKQPCCGAIFERLLNGENLCHQGQRQKLVSLQSKKLATFLKWLPKEVYFLAKGCQCFVANTYDHILDIYSLIESILNKERLSLYFSTPKEVYYQPYCDKRFSVEDSLWRLLTGIEGLKVKKMANPLACCGGYCGETVLNPKQAEALAYNKITPLPQSATLIVTSPDCWGLFKTFQGDKNLNILHPIQLLYQTLLKNLS